VRRASPTRSIAVAVLGGDDDPRGDAVGQRAGGVEFDAARVERSQRQPGRGGGGEARRLRHHVDAAGGVDVAEDRTGRAFQYLDPLDRGGIACGRAAAIGDEPVDIIFAAAIGGAEEAADREIVGEAAAVVLLAAAADQFQRVAEAIGAGGAQDVLFERAAGLRHAVGREVGRQRGVARGRCAEHDDLLAPGRRPRRHRRVVRRRTIRRRAALRDGGRGGDRGGDDERPREPRRPRQARAGNRNGQIVPLMLDET